jgi:hypothetical protein
MTRIAPLVALGLGLVPATAWAHGDHSGLRGAVHVMTSADHLGLALMALLMTGVIVHWLRGFRANDRSDQA